MKKLNKNITYTASVLAFSVIAVFGLSMFTGNARFSNVKQSSASAQKPADINNDNVVDIFDLSILLSNWNGSDNLCDLNSDGTVNIFDLSELLSSWGNVATVNAPLPFDMPDYSTLTSSPKKVFANYFIAHPISIDNKASSDDAYTKYYLNNQWRGSANTADESYWLPEHGGALRDRPLPTSVKNCTDDASKPYNCWMLENMKIDVQNAIDAGLDGFELDIYSTPEATNNNHWKQAYALIDAAAQVNPNFKIIITPDYNSATWKALSADGLADYLKLLMVDQTGTHFKPSIYIDSFNKGVVSVYPSDEQFPDNSNRPVSYWGDVITAFAVKTGGLKLAMWSQLTDYNSTSTTSKDYTESAVIDAIGTWATAGAKSTIEANTQMRINCAHGGCGFVSVDSNGGTKKYVQYLHGTDYRPIQHIDGYYDAPGVYWESNATEALRRQWQAGTTYGADHMQFITWNDYTETAVAPSVGHGFGYVDLSAFYLVKFKTGQYPAVKRDALYLTHRSQAVAATPNCANYVSPKIKCSLLMTEQTGLPAFDKIEVTTYLTSPATVKVYADGVEIGSKTYAAIPTNGIDVFNVPLTTGTVSAKIIKNNITTTTVTSPYAVTNTPEVQDMQYHIVSSLRTP